jgi:hypothetical protein
MYCTKCGFQLNQGARFCTKCGTSQLPNESVQQVIETRANDKDKQNTILGIIFFIGALFVVAVKLDGINFTNVAECHDKKVVEEVSVTSIGTYKRFVIDSLRKRNANTFGMGRGQSDDWIVGMLIQQKFPLPTESQLNVSVANFGSVKTQSFQKEILKRQCSAAVEFNIGQFKDDAAAYSVFMQMFGGASSEIPKRMLISYDIQYDKQLKQSVVDNVHFVR